MTPRITALSLECPLIPLENHDPWLLLELYLIDCI
jgi:hypothetical protein